MLLSDIDIHSAIQTRAIQITPYNHDQLNPASYDVTLDHRIRVPNYKVKNIDLAAVTPGHTDLVEIDEELGYVLHPGGFLLASTAEYFRVGPGTVARVEGKSSVGRLGLTVHVTAGYIDPGFSGNITLEIVNHAPWSITLRRGVRIAQIAFEHLLSAPQKDYTQTGSYCGQSGPTESRYRSGLMPA